MVERDHAADENFKDCGPKTLYFNRDFELIRKIGLLPPTVGGSIGGSILAVGGEQGGARVGIWERSMNTPSVSQN